MPVRVLIPGPLQPFAAGRRRVDVAGATVRTVGDVLAALAAVHPGVRDRVLDERGHVRAHINIFVGEDNIRDAEGLATPVPPDCELAILPAVSGG